MVIKIKKVKKARVKKAKVKKVRAKTRVVLPKADCLYCGKPLPLYRRSTTKFCSEEHRTLYNAHKQYIRHGSKLSFKKKARLRSKKWIKKNKERFNQLAREAMFRLNLKKKIAREMNDALDKDNFGG